MILPICVVSLKSLQKVTIGSLGVLVISHSLETETPRDATTVSPRDNQEM